MIYRDDRSSQTGSFDRRGRTLCKTPSPSIDILLPSNLERFLYFMNGSDAGLINQWYPPPSHQPLVTPPSVTGNPLPQ